MFVRLYAAPFLLAQLAVLILAFATLKMQTPQNIADAADVPSNTPAILCATFAVISAVACAATFAAFLIGQTKRLHDMGQDGIWILLNFLPPFNAVLLFCTLAVKGDPDTNEHGHNPVIIKRKHRHYGGRSRHSEARHA